MLIIAQVLKEEWLEITGFAHSQTTNKLVNKAANDSARVSGQDRKKPPALGTNQIAGSGGFRTLASLEKIKFNILPSFFACLTDFSGFFLRKTSQKFDIFCMENVGRLSQKD